MAVEFNLRKAILQYRDPTILLDELGIVDTSSQEGDIATNDKKSGNIQKKYIAKKQLRIWQNSINLFKEVYREKKISASNFAIRYCLDFQGVTTVIPGMNTRNHVRANLKAVETKKLSLLDHKRIRDIYLSNIFYLKELKGTKDRI